MLRELEENTEKQFKYIRKTVKEQNEKYNRQNKKKIKILELKNTMTEQEFNRELQQQTRLNRGICELETDHLKLTIQRSKKKKK